MLQVFRDHAHKWFVKLLLSLIVLSFGLWGIGDVIYKFFAHRPVVKIGSHSISQEELSHHLQKENARIKEMTKGKITPQQLRALNVHTSVINRMVSQLVLNDELERIGLGVSDEALKDQVHGMPAFKTDGKFDANKFMSALHQESMSERTFLKEARFSIISQQLLASISLGANLPEFYKKTISDALTRERIFTLVEVGAADMNIEPANAEQIESYYEQFKERYMVNELRNISVLILDNQAMRQLIGISDEDVREFYHKQKDKLKYPERRNIKRLTFAQEDKAQKAHKMAKNGMSLAKIAKEIPGGELEEPGLVVKEQIPEFAAEAVFEVEAGKTTKVIPTGFGFHIFQVTKVESPRTATFEEAKGEIEALLIQEKKAGKLDDIRSQIDDALAAGQSLSDVGAKMKLQVHNYDGINAKGQNAEGKLVLTLPKGLQLVILEKAFTVEQGLDSGFVDVPEQGAFVLTVNKVHPAHSPDFADVTKKVISDWEAEQKLEAAAKLASSIASEAKSLDKLSSLASKHDLKISRNYTISRIDMGKSNRKLADILPVALAEKAFMLAPETAIAGRNEKSGFTVVMFQKTGDIKTSKEELQNIPNRLLGMVQADVSSATINYLREQHELIVNQEMLAQMME